MPFERPTLSDLVTRVSEDFRSRLGITGSLARRAMAKVLATVWAGAVHMVHGHLEWLSRQLFPDTAEQEFLLRQSAMYGLSLTPATYASGTVTATGVNGSVIPVDATLVRNDGATYRVTAEATISGGTATVSVEAMEAGADGNLDQNTTLTFESPIVGVDATVTVDPPGLTGGTDEESIEAHRKRVLLRLRQPPQGGAEHDYEQWALAVAGVTRVWVYPHENGLGTVVVRFVRDEDASIFPDASEVQAVQDAIDAERPITAEVTVMAPVALPVAFTISVTPDTQAVRDAVVSELQDLFFRDAEPGDGAGRGTILRSQMLTAIGVAEGVEDFTLLAPAGDVVPGVGELATLGTITWS